MSRIVDILQAIQAGTSYTPNARSRAEGILKSIANGTLNPVNIPQSRYEEILSAIKAGTPTTLTAQTRLESLLTAIANGTIASWLVGKNLYNPNSEWNINASMSPPSLLFPASFDGDRRTFFFKVQGGQQYTISFGTTGDRLGITEYYTDIHPELVTVTNSLENDNVIISLANIIPNEYTFTTSPQTKVVGIYYSLGRLATNVKIEIGSTATDYTCACFDSELEEEFYKAFI